jgi:hypothetical protein
VVRAEWEDKDLELWTPAFKVHPRNFMRVAKTMTLAQPGERITEQLPRSHYHPVNLPAADSAECVRVLLAEFARPKQAFFPQIGEVRIGVAETQLVYVPFQEIGGEVRHPHYRICIPRNLLEYGRNL